MWASQGSGRPGMTQNSPYGSAAPNTQAQLSPMLGPATAYQNPGGMNMQASPGMNMQPSPMQQSMGGWSIMSPYMTHHGEMAIVPDGSPPNPEDEVTLWEAREFGKNDRLNKGQKRERLQILNTHGGSVSELSLDLNGLQPSEGTTVLEMAKSLREKLGDLVTSAKREKSRTLSFSLADDSPIGPKATIGLLLGDQGIARCQVYGCVPGSPAYLSGKLQKGDVIQQVDAVPVTGVNIITRVRGDDSPGSKVTLTVERAGKKRPMEIGLIRAPVPLVNKKRQIYEMITNLAQMAGASPFESEVEDGPTNLGRECCAVLKEIFYKHFENEVLLKEEVQSRENVVFEAQRLLESFIFSGKTSMATNPSQEQTVSTPIAAPLDRRPMATTDSKEDKSNRVNLVKAMKAAQADAAKFQKLLGELEAVNTEQAQNLKEKEAEISRMAEALAASKGQEGEIAKKHVQVEQVQVQRAAPPKRVDSEGTPDGDSEAAAKSHAAAEEAWRRTKEELMKKLVEADEQAQRLSKQIETLVESGVGSSLESVLALLHNKLALSTLSQQRHQFEVHQLKAQLRAAQAQANQGGQGALEAPSDPHGGVAVSQKAGSGADEELEILRGQVEALSGQGKGLMAEMAAKDAELGRLAAQATEQQGSLRELAAALSNKDEERERLAQRLADKEASLADKEGREKSAAEKVAQHPAELDRLAAEVARLGTALALRETQLAQREAQLNERLQQGKGPEEEEKRLRQQQLAELAAVQEKFEKFKGEAAKSRQLAESTMSDQSHRISTLEGKLRADYDKAALAEAEAAAARKEAESLRRQLMALDRAHANATPPRPAARPSSSSSSPSSAEAASLRVELEESRALIAQLNAELAAARSRPSHLTSSDALPPAAVSVVNQPHPPRHQPPSAALQARAAPPPPPPENGADVSRLKEELRRTQAEVQQERRAYAAGVERLKRQRDELAAEVAAIRDPSLASPGPRRAAAPPPPPPTHHSPPTPPTSSGAPSAPKLMSPAVAQQRVGTPTDPAAAARLHTARASQPHMRM